MCSMNTHFLHIPIRVDKHFSVGDLYNLFFNLQGRCSRNCSTFKTSRTSNMNIDLMVYCFSYGKPVDVLIIPPSLAWSNGWVYMGGVNQRSSQYIKSFSSSFITLFRTLPTSCSCWATALLRNKEASGMGLGYSKLLRALIENTFFVCMGWHSRHSRESCFLTAPAITSHPCGAPISSLASKEYADKSMCRWVVKYQRELTGMWGERK